MLKLFPVDRRHGLLAIAGWLVLSAAGLVHASGSGPDPPGPFQNPALTVALALLSGFLCQALGHHIRIPGIILLLGAGVLLGPEVLGLVQPSTLGEDNEGLNILVGFAVAVILFEGGLNLDIRRLRREQRAIQLLITVGALVTWIGAALCARLFLPWGWSSAILFGSLVIVTGPTVITPLLRRVKVKQPVSTILEAEGLLIDAVGAVIAFVMLDVVVTNPQGLAALARELGGIFELLAAGVVLGLVGGVLLMLLLRVRHLVPEGMENIFVLAAVLVLFSGANAVWHESGIAAVTVAGIVLGNMRTRVQRELREFKEQLTLLFIGMLFVLLSADVKLADVQALGWGGVLTVAGLVLVVRPLNVLAGTFGSDLSWKEKTFIAWIGPRGIVAAAVASLFATKLEPAIGNQIRAMVFLTIAVTVMLAGLLGSPVARWLGLRRKSDHGWVVIGANELGCELALALKQGGQEVVVVDSNSEAIQEAEKRGLRAIWGNALEERTLLRAEIDTRAGAIGLTPNGKLNLLLAQRVREEEGPQRIYVAVKLATSGGAVTLVHEAGVELLSGRPFDVEVWSTRLRRGRAAVERWRLGEAPAPEPATDSVDLVKGNDDVEQEKTHDLYLPLVRYRGDRARPIAGESKSRVGDEVTFVVHRANERAVKSLEAAGWTRVVPEPDAEPAGERQAG